MLNRAMLVGQPPGCCWLASPRRHGIQAQWLRRRRQAEYPEDHAAEGFQALVQGSVEALQEIAQGLRTLVTRMFAGDASQPS
jgi:hypothetical protein